MNIQQLFHAKTLVEIFMRTFEQGIYPAPERTPCEVAVLRGNLIDEEVKEYYHAESAVEGLDALCDILYVTLGSHVAMSVPVELATPSSSDLRALAKPVVQDLYSRFPCMLHQRKGLNALNAAIIALAAASKYNLKDAFNAVHENNMEKLWNDYKDTPTGYTACKKPQGWLVKDGYGKVVKPPYHRPVDLTPYV